jgi:hypothetical protein
MSAIAEWYLLPMDRVPALTEICQPTKASWWRSPSRNFEAFWQFLDTQALKGSGLDASGWVMNPLLELLRERHGVPVDAAEGHPLVAAIAIDSFLVIEAVHAKAWREGLDAALADPAALGTYLTEWYGEAPEGAPQLDVHVEGLRYLRAGVEKLEPGSVLLVAIG